MRALSKAVEVVWRDAVVNIDGEIPEVALMTSVGYIHSKDKNRLILVSMYGSKKDPRITTTIPTSLIKSIRRLK